MPLFPLFIVTALLLATTIAKYTFALALKVSGPTGMVKKDYSHQPTVTVLMPCFNEGKVAYQTIESISKSHYPRDKFEIVALDDCSDDDSYEWMRRAARDFPNVRVFKNEANYGKAQTVLNALELSAAEIVISIDSDCIFAPNAIQELVACFADPKVGAVGGRVGVKNPNDNALTMAQVFVYYLTFTFAKLPENWTRTVTCISGCLFAIRRHLYVQIAPRVTNRNWFNIQVNTGEDRFLTHQVLLHGYGTYVNTDAKCWTTVPNTWVGLFKQQHRWRRSVVRDFFMTIRTLPEHIRVVHLNGVYCLVVQHLAVIATALLMFLTPLTSVLFWIVPSGLFLCGAIAAVIHFVIKRWSPEQTISDPLRLVAVSVYKVVDATLTLIALASFDVNAWGTRHKAKATAVAKLVPEPASAAAAAGTD